MTSLHAGERLIIWRTQPTTTSSSSVNAGLDCYERPSTPRSVLMKSPSIDESSLFDGKYAKKLGRCQCDKPGTMTHSSSPSTASNVSGSTGGEDGSSARTAPGSVRDITGRSATWAL